MLYLFLQIFTNLFYSLAKMNFFILLGRLAQYFPSTVKEKASRIINQLLYELEKEVKTYTGYQ
jgi:hypothetical protein